MKKFIIAIFTTLCLTSAAISMSSAPPKAQTADQIAAQQTALLSREAAQQTGMPAIANFTEKKALKWLYELRDEPNYSTETFIVTMNGDFVKVCDSVGYGINASIQYSNPERVLHDAYVSTGKSTSHGAVTIPQPEPSGLFYPEGLAATYVICVDPEKDDVKAVYIEPEIIVFPAGLHKSAQNTQ